MRDDERGGQENEAGLSLSGGMVEQLIGSVHRLSVASLASISTVDRKDEVHTTSVTVTQVGIVKSVTVAGCRSI